MNFYYQQTIWNFIFFSPAHWSNLFPFLGYGYYRYSKLMGRILFRCSLCLSLSLFLSYLIAFVSIRFHFKLLIGFLSSHSCVLSDASHLYSISFSIIFFDLFNLAKESSTFHHRDLNPSSFHVLTHQMDDNYKLARSIETDD